MALAETPDTENIISLFEARGGAEARSVTVRAKKAGLVRRAVAIEPIRCEAGAVDMLATVGEDALIQAGAHVYQRGKELMRPCRRELPGDRGLPVVAAGVAEIKVHGLIDELNRAVEWQKFDGRAKVWVICDPPTKVAETILSRSGQWRLRSLAGVISTPTIRPDGSLLTAPGYDPATRLFHVADSALNLPAVPLSKESAQRALAELEGLLAEFPFLTDVDRSVALSALITPVARGCMSVAPLHAFRSPTPGSGKSYVADLSSMIATGRRCPVVPPANKPEEAEKRLAGMLLGGYPLVSLDNVNGELGGDLLCQAIERPLMQIRIFGTLDIQEVENRACIFANGNGLRIRGDMTRRTIMADLDSGEERPEQRQFKSDPVITVESDRARYVSACLTVVRAFQAADEAERPDVPPLASFEDWSRSVRSALIWLGKADPCRSMAAARESDPELEDLRVFVRAWANIIGVGKECASTTNEAVSLASKRLATDFGVDSNSWEYPEFRDALLGTCGPKVALSPRNLGRWLTSRAGRIVDKKRFVRGKEDRNGSILWFLESVSPEKCGE